MSKEYIDGFKYGSLDGDKGVRKSYIQIMSRILKMYDDNSIVEFMLGYEHGYTLADRGINQMNLN